MAIQKKSLFATSGLTRKVKPLAAAVKTEFRPLKHESMKKTVSVMKG
jgi:hypothetical protein